MSKLDDEIFAFALPLPVFEAVCVGHVTDTVTNKTTNNQGETVHEPKGTQASYLFRSTVQCAHKQRECCTS